MTPSPSSPGPASPSASRKTLAATVPASTGSTGWKCCFIGLEIARELAAGTVDLGVTARIWCARPSSTGKPRRIAARLGFGAADVVVAVPDVWYDVATMADLDDVAADFRQRHGRRLRIATKYWRLTQRFFSQMHGIQVIASGASGRPKARRRRSADVIVDITSTGATLDANHLRVLEDGVILKSQARLVAAQGAQPGRRGSALGGDAAICLISRGFSSIGQTEGFPSDRPQSMFAIFSNNAVTSNGIVV